MSRPELSSAANPATPSAPDADARERSLAPGALPREVVRLGWVSFCMDVASEMVFPLVPLFLATLTASPGLALGAIEGLAEATLSALNALTGRRSDRIRRRVPFVRWGYGISAASKPLLALARAWPLVLVARVLDRVGKGVRTSARDALIADLAPRDRGGRAFGLHRAMDTAGALVGVLLALGLVRAFPGGYRTIFALALLPGAACVALTLTLREPRRASEAGSERERARGDSGSREAHSDERALGRVRELPAGYWRSIVPLLVFALGSSSVSFLLLRAKDLGWSDLRAIAGYAVFNAAYALASWPAGILSDRVGRWRVLALGWTLYALAYAGFGAGNAAWLWALFALVGVYMGTTDGVGKALIADHAPPEQRGTALGTYSLGAGLATLVGSSIAGLAWDRVSHAAPFWIGGAGSVLALAAIPFAARARMPARGGVERAGGPPR